MGDGPNIPWRLLEIDILVEDKETGGMFFYYYYFLLTRTFLSHQLVIHRTYLHSYIYFPIV